MSETPISEPRSRLVACPECQRILDQLDAQEFNECVQARPAVRLLRFVIAAVALVTASGIVVAIWRVWL